MPLKIENPLLNETVRQSTGLAVFRQFLPRLIGLMFICGVIIFIFVMAIGAIQWITSGADKASLEAARNKVVSAVLGIFILFIFFAVLTLIQTIFGIQFFNLDISQLPINFSSAIPPVGPH